MAKAKSKESKIDCKEAKEGEEKEFKLTFKSGCRRRGEQEVTNKSKEE